MPPSLPSCEPVRCAAPLRLATLWLANALLAFIWHGQGGDPAAWAAVDGTLIEAHDPVSHASPDHPAPPAGDGDESGPDDASCAMASRSHAVTGASSRVASFCAGSAGGPFAAYRAQAPPHA